MSSEEVVEIFPMPKYRVWFTDMQQAVVLYDLLYSGGAFLPASSSTLMNVLDLSRKELIEKRRNAVIKLKCSAIEQPVAHKMLTIFY